MILDGNNPHGGDVYRQPVRLDFSANVNPCGAPKAVRDAARAAASELAIYPDPRCGALREALAERLGVDTGEIVCGNGASELIFQFCAALRPKKALLPVPCFSDYEAALRAAGCEPEFFLLFREEGFRVPARLLDAITPETELLLLASPNNPTGRCVSPDLLRQLLTRCRETGTWLFLDECFFELTDAERADTLLGELREQDRVFLLRAFTKAWGMAGLRLGYGVCRNRAFLERLCALSQAWNVSGPAQAAGLAALKCPEWPERARDLISREKPRLKRELEALGLKVLPGDANYLFFSGPPELGARLAERGVLIRDCGNYRGLSAGDYRVAVRTRRENRELIEAMREVLHA